MVVEIYRKGQSALPTSSIESPFYMQHIIHGRPLVVMERKEVVVGAALVTGALLLLIAAGFAVYFCCRRRRKTSTSADPESDQQPTTSRSLNGFLSLKTPLISTKTLG
ncbi:uncharacterized protein LOC106666637 [Cimex lectularius]|uniref:Uncharacterized protein n=1 Tax=Cimex lectularius TaxID=79782 RepID=A0A8I6STB8_CIMLE|nr:uncharacterized protein LOC106666637 [Cimex lectularius]XP_024082486.1 uncharacterized protein LOC106666637 [Cimex lectularius]